MTKLEQVLELVDKEGPLRPRHLALIGLPRNYLWRLWRKGRLEKIGPGLYASKRPTAPSARADHRFRVRIVYREPVYELYHGAKREPYEWTYTIPANTYGEARRLAVDELRATALDSGVSWHKEILEVSVE